MGASSSKESEKSQAKPPSIIEKDCFSNRKEEATDPELVQWFWKANQDPFSEETPRWEEYNEYQNMQIENAFLNKKGSVDLGTYIVNFETMFQYLKSDSYRMRKVKREIIENKNIRSSQGKIETQLLIEEKNEGLCALGLTCQHFLDATRIRCGFQYFNFTIYGAVQDIRKLGHKLHKENDLEMMQKHLRKLEVAYKRNEMCTVSDVKEHIVGLYLMPTFLYSEVNKYLRDEDWESLKQIYSYFYYMMQCMNYYVCEPLTEPLTVYSGRQLKPQQLEFYDHKLGVFAWNTFLSTTIVKEVASMFASGCGNSDMISTLFIITLHNKVYDVSKFSDYKEEKEVLLPPGTLFKYIKREVKDGMHFIYLKTASQENIKAKEINPKYIKESFQILMKQDNPIVAVHSLVDLHTLNENEVLSQYVFEMIKGIKCKCLSISDTNNRVVKELAHVLPFVNIDSLSISRCIINESAKALASALKQSSINNLSIEFRDCDSMNINFAELLPHSRIKNLKIICKKFDENAAIDLLKVLPSTQIMTLDISASDLFTDRIGEYALSILEQTNLQSLSFSSTSISNEMVHKINALCRQLHETRESSIKIKIEKKDYVNSKFVKAGSQPIYSKNGDVYIGDLKNKEKHGTGMIYYPNGNKYEGEWRHGNHNGAGIFFFSDGHIYEGKWKDNRKHGNGKEFWPSGDKYEGGYENGSPNGIGTYFYADGGQYTGEWRDGRKHGNGIYYSNGDNHNQYSEDHLIKGSWVNGELNGRAILWKSNGDRYEQVYANGKVLSEKKI